MLIDEVFNEFVRFIVWVDGIVLGRRWIYWIFLLSIYFLDKSLFFLVGDFWLRVLFFWLFKKKNVFIFCWFCLKIYLEYEDKYNKFVYFYDMYILLWEWCFFSNWWKFNIIMIFFFKNYFMGIYICEECFNIIKFFMCGYKNIWLYLCIFGEKFVWLLCWDGILNMNWFFLFFFL